MINFNDSVNENKTEHNKNWPYAPDHPYRILIIGGSESGKTNVLLNLIEFDSCDFCDQTCFCLYGIIK